MSCKVYGVQGDSEVFIKDLVYAIVAPQKAATAAESVALSSAFSLAEPYLKRGLKVKIFTDADEGVIKSMLPRAPQGVEVVKIDRSQNKAHLPKSARRRILTEVMSHFGGADYE